MTAERPQILIRREATLQHCYKLRHDNGRVVHISKSISNIIEDHGKYVTIEVPWWWAEREGLMDDIDFFYA